MLLGFTLPLLLLVWVASTLGAQISLSPQAKTESTTLVDLLSADPDYTLVLRLLQRARLIPTLNKLNQSTFFAPTNNAINSYALSNPIWATNLDFTDNVNYKLRQQLLYHLLNFTISSLPHKSLQVYDTLYFPENLPSTPTPPPWLPVPGGTLDGKPQRLRIAPREGKAWVGVDSRGSNGYNVVKDMVVGSNGNLVGLNGVIEMPSDLESVVAHHPSLSYVASLLSPKQRQFLASTPALTVFLPLNDIWQTLHPIERLYLESEFSEADVFWIIRMHAIGEGGVGWSDTFGKGRNFTTFEGSPVEVIPSSAGTTVSGAELVESDIYASNGVLHVVSDLLLPPGSLQLTPEKYLLALNCTTFVSLLHSVELTPLINSTQGKFTILATRDDVLGINQEKLPERGTEALKNALKYHFVQGRWPASKLKDGMLLQTALTEDGLNGGHQVLTVNVVQDFDKGKGISFGGAGIIGDPIEINNVLIYLISRPLAPPVDPIETALPSLHLSSFIASIFATGMATTLKTTPETTILMPSNNAFEKLGLVTTYLLSASSKPDLQKVIMHHSISGVEYISRLQNGSEQTLKTLEGSDLHIQRSDSPTSKGLAVNPSGGWAGSMGMIKTDQGNTLTQTGVIHEIDGLLLPRSVELTVGKLVRAAKGGTMASLITRAGMDWVLNGTAPPEDVGEEWGWEGLGGDGWTLLCPTDDAFKGVNLTKMWEDLYQLRQIVAQHLIPPSSASARSSSSSKGKGAFDTDRDNVNIPIDIDRAANSIYPTVLSRSSSYGDLVFLHRDSDDGDNDGKDTGYVVGIKDARGTQAREDWARVLSWGRSTTSIQLVGKGGRNGFSRGGVIAIDRLLAPFQPSWYIEYGQPLAVGIGGVLGIAAFFWTVAWFWKKDTVEATYEPIGPAEEDE